MNTKNLLIAAAVALSFVAPTQSFAEFGDDAYKKRVALSKQIKKMKNMRKQLPSPPPSGLFGVYAFPEKGQYVAGVNFQHHEFDGLLNGSTSVSAAETTHAATGSSNQFYGDSGQPATLRVVPNSAKANVVMPFINYTLDDKIALVAVAPIIEKESKMETFKGDGTGHLGNFTIKSKGLGDVKFGALYKAYNSEDNKHNVIIDAVLSAPTGSVTETDVQLSPANTTPTARLGYGMQLGGGTWDAMVGAAYWGKDDKWGYGAQYLATIPLEDKNSEGWRFGDKHELTAWGSYSWESTLVSSFRLRTEHQDAIHGIDSNIYGPGLGAQTANYGGKITEASVGVNYMYAPAKNISIEISKPISQDRNGVQADKDSSIA
ncbi:MAG: hypothetical protein ISR70_04395, partial [Candidatus Thioglobus sp.]|nr:hypothetical protein [Candidatus Thioglobus sp.]